jgi:D-inositol-3-phosphate glycosyltransferase
MDRAGRIIGSKVQRLLDSKDTLYAGITSSCCELLVDAYKIPLEKIYMIPLGADHLKFRPDEGLRKEFRDKLGISKDQYLVVNTGKMHPEKRVDVLIKAVGIAREKIPNIRMIQVGGGSNEHMAIIQRAIKEANVADIVQLIPAVENKELANYYRAADICAWTGSVTISMIEAASCGTSLLVVKTPGLEYQVSNGNAVVCEQNASSEDIAGGLIKLCTDDAYRLELGRRGRELVENRLSYEKLNKAFMSLYEGRPFNEYRWKR